MSAQRIDIEQFLSLAQLHPVLDVRSPGEYKHAHIPGAHSFPLFTDEERKIVGTTYKQNSREEAIKIGLDLKNYPFQLIGGYTGSGKTELLVALKKEKQLIVDLEEIAGHKGSAFGNIGLPPQPGQEQFENCLSMALHGCVQANASTPIWLEDESQRIGTVNIPNELWNTMRKSSVYFLDIPFEKRLEHIVEEYGQLNREAIIAAIGRITKKLGHLQAQQAVDYLQENNTVASFTILLRYYDKLYEKSLQNREGLEKLLTAIPADQTGAANVAALLSIKQV